MQNSDALGDVVLVDRTHAAPRDETLRVALAQLAPSLGNVERNLALHQATIERAAQADADLVLFPELSLTGYFLRDMVPEVALARDAPELTALLAGAGTCDVVLGFVEQSPSQRFYNSALYAEAGQLRYVHQKVYLPTYGLFDEQRYFAAGHRFQAFSTRRLGRVGLLICEDFWHISAAAIMQAEGVDWLICVANSPARGVAGDRVSTAQTYARVAATYAQLLGAVVIVVNRAGFEDGLCFWGGSLVAAPNGELLAEGPQLDPALLVVAIDRGELRRERIMTPLGRDERLLLTIEELQRVKRRLYEGPDG